MFQNKAHARKIKIHNIPSCRLCPQGSQNQPQMKVPYSCFRVYKELCIDRQLSYIKTHCSNPDHLIGIRLITCHYEDEDEISQQMLTV